MKLIYFLPLFVFATVAGCSPKAEEAGRVVDPEVKLSVQEQIKKIQEDPNMPDGLKQIKIKTLQSQPSDKPGAPR